MKAAKHAGASTARNARHRGKSDRTRQMRDAAASREAILDAARKLFSSRGYQRAGVREIARSAGVTAGLVTRYFGTKERLLHEVLFARDYPSPGAFLTDRERFGESLARLTILHRPNSGEFDPLLILLRSIGDPEAGRIINTEIENWIESLVAGLKTPNAKVRGEMIAALLGGFLMFRKVLRLNALAEADNEELIEILGSALQSFVTVASAPSTGGAHPGETGIRAPVPVLRVFSWDLAQQFYRDFLGFGFDWMDRGKRNDEPMYAQVSRAGTVLHLSERFEDATPGTTLVIPTDDLDDLAKELGDRQLQPIDLKIHTRSQHIRELAILDPFGNRLRFCENALQRRGWSS